MATAKQKIAERRRASAAAVSNLSALGQGVKSIPRRVVNYIRGSTPSDVARDVGNVASSTFSALKEDPAGFIGDTIFFPFSAYRDFSDMRAAAARLRRQGRNAEAQKLEALAGASALGAIPVLGRVSGAAIRDAEKAVTKGALSAAEKRVAKSMAVKALPAPPKPLALPAPGPGLPPQASKPRGGQFYPDATLGPKDAQAAGYKLENFTDRNGVDRYVVVTPEGEAVNRYHASTPEGGWELANAHFKTNRNLTQANLSPEAAARDARETYSLTPYVNENNAPQAKLGDWLERALAKYYKTDFGAPNDPLLSLAERGLHYDPEMTPERWQRTVNENLMEDPIGFFTVPRHESEIKAQFAGEPQRFSFLGSYDPMGQGALMQAAPWLRKQPVTDMLYGIKGGLDLGHFTDEMQNALRAREVGLPMELAVRPESLDRMTFAQAAEHVGKINQFRVKEMERAALSALDSPAIQTFKEYNENNPLGLRWVELKAPELTEALDTDFDRQLIQKGDAEGNPFSIDVLNMARGQRAKSALEEALKYEGDKMGHCVGGYCPDVMEGRSRIFSLRDAKGEPHVTIETAPKRAFGRDDRDAIYDQAFAEIDANPEYRQLSPEARNQLIINRQAELADALRAEREANPVEDIIQIKGKQNRAPKDDYLPFVQDFVKSQKWGNVGDLANTGLVRLPDGRYITAQQAEEGIAAIPDRVGNAVYDPSYLHAMDPDIWSQVAPYFEGFAIGGRVERDRCFCRHPMAAK